MNWRWKKKTKSKTHEIKKKKKNKDELVNTHQKYIKSFVTISRCACQSQRMTSTRCIDNLICNGERLFIVNLQISDRMILAKKTDKHSPCSFTKQFIHNVIIA